MTDLSRLLGKRWPTMHLALDLLEARGGTRIVETGCAYTPGDWAGAGLSTVIFGEWATQHGGSLSSVDIDPAHIRAAEHLASGPITYIEMDSVAYLSLRDDPIDLLYLDSLDYPYGTLLDLYGGKMDLPAAIRRLDAMIENEIVVLHSDIIRASQEHCAAEVLAALPALHERSVVLIDDARLPGGGKARLAKEVLREAGWQRLADDYQTLWVR